ncbi:hypothetical protein N7507_005317 [Penicillium longicatenatum]|nr:hypothetical protein N7507_005317 [Penicillium longicatenatum]
MQHYCWARKNFKKWLRVLGNDNKVAAQSTIGYRRRVAPRAQLQNYPEGMTPSNKTLLDWVEAFKR